MRDTQELNNFREKKRRKDDTTNDSWLSVNEINDLSRLMKLITFCSIVVVDIFCVCGEADDDEKKEWVSLAVGWPFSGIHSHSIISQKKISQDKTRTQQRKLP